MNLSQAMAKSLGLSQISYEPGRWFVTIMQDVD
jgi:hypothetical protein